MPEPARLPTNTVFSYDKSSWKYRSDDCMTSGSSIVGSHRRLLCGISYDWHQWHIGYGQSPGDVNPASRIECRALRTSILSDEQLLVRSLFLAGSWLQRSSIPTLSTRFMKGSSIHAFAVGENQEDWSDAAYSGKKVFNMPLSHVVIVVLYFMAIAEKLFVL